MDNNLNSTNNGFNQPPPVNQFQTENSYSAPNNNDSYMMNGPANTTVDTGLPSSNPSQYVSQNNTPPQLNFAQPNHSGIFTFNIPGQKIIIIPTSSPNISEIFTLDIPDSKIIIIILSLP
ncbi:hypothetical protein RclHR1_18170001 [Rhizophagus clarus]|uniref:Uncharacterized protein n=1 Tax=Rhizophagus clarus TaxID=94130 RepID=A0A2Z6QNB8_9GLOM|nr:hypothetical protein RclHR1_18170001 [Rhizophagus clarus]GET02718.1 hypothetical protein GLOIN_2v1807857 [Rhizophagus clarus]